MEAAQKKLVSFLYVGCWCKQQEEESWGIQYPGSSAGGGGLQSCCHHHQVQAILVWGSNQQIHLCHHKHHLVDPDGTQTHNPQLQNPPKGERSLADFCQSSQCL